MNTKECVLSALMEADGEISGEQLAQWLGISRNSVWKAVENLRHDGYAIEAGRNRGYRLIGDADVLSQSGIRQYLQAKDFGCEMELHDRIDSTNTRAKALAAQGARHGTLVVAGSQSSGRGRFGRVFHSPEDSGIYVSFILRPTIPAEQAAMMTSCAAVAVAQAIERLADVQVQIKWVNDLLIGGQKVCGILCGAGMDFESGGLEYLVVGVGVNVRRMEFPPELSDIATSIGNACGQDVSRNRLIAEICNCMEAFYGQLETGAFMEENRARSCVLGKPILVLRGGENYPAIARAIDDQGGLVIETEAGMQTLRSGEISIRLQERP